LFGFCLKYLALAQVQIANSGSIWTKVQQTQHNCSLSAAADKVQPKEV